MTWRFWKRRAKPVIPVAPCIYCMGRSFRRFESKAFCASCGKERVVIV